MKHILPLSILLCSLSASADSAWRMHPTFDGEVTHLIDTPHYIYFTSRQLPKGNGLTDDFIALFRFDKEGEEMQSLTSENILSSTMAYDVVRNSAKDYVAVVGADYSIDFLFDNGKRESMADYKSASLSYPKTVNSITIDPEKDRLYFATNFGFVEINDKKFEIAESRNYGQIIKSVARMGDHFLMLTTTGLLSAPYSSSRMPDDFKEISEFYVPLALFPLSDDKCLLLSHGGAPLNLYVLSAGDDGKVEIGQPIVGDFSGFENNEEGVSCFTKDIILQFRKDGTYTSYRRPDDDKDSNVAVVNGAEHWFAKGRKGLKKMNLSQETGWTLTTDYVLPDAPSPFITGSMAEHPEYGFMMSNFGKDGKKWQYAGNSPELLSSYKMGRWQNHLAPYKAPELPVIIKDPYGFTIDPDNPDYIYMSSLMSGMARLNLSDPYDIIHFGNPSNPAANDPGFVALLPDVAFNNNWSCSLSLPRFDSDGNLWTLHANYDYNESRRLPVYCWEAADRRATTSVDNMRPPKMMFVDGIAPTHQQNIFPLQTKRSRNLLLYVCQEWTPDIVVIDTNGTPLDQTDDRVARLTNYTDQDGNPVNCTSISAVYEDPSTGYIWIGYSEGVFYFDPAAVLNGSAHLTQIKVPRNDGTNLADYLLNGVVVTDIISDGNGNKWFATLGAGVVNTSPDGRTILRELTTENSVIPNNEVMKLGYVKENNSIMLSTMKGLAEYTLPATGMEKDADVKVYPNPVRPGYSGYITIDGLAEGALVKIVDSRGNLVKELGPVSGTSVEWDGTNIHFQRPGTGVYYIMTSSADSDSSYSRVGKVLFVK